MGLGVDDVRAVCVDAGHPDHHHRGHDEQRVVHGQPQQQSVHRTGHRWPAIDRYVDRSMEISTVYLDRMTAESRLPIKPRREIPLGKNIDKCVLPPLMHVKLLRFKSYFYNETFFSD